MHIVPHIVSLAGFAGLLVVAAMGDLRAYRIPNAVSLGVAALYPVYAWSAGAGWTSVLVSGLLAGALVFAVTTPLFFFGIIGGGDAKLLSAVALWAGMDKLMALLVIVTLAGGMLSAAVWLRSRLTRKDNRDNNNKDVFSGLPARAGNPEKTASHRLSVAYGAAIAVGGLYIAALAFAGGIRTLEGAA